MSNPKAKQNDSKNEGKLPPWLAKKKEKEMEEAKKEDEVAEESEECSCDPDDDLPWCDDCDNKDMEEAKKYDDEEEMKEESEDDDCDNKDMEEAKKYDDEEEMKEEEECDDDDDEEEMKEEDKKKSMKEHLAPLFKGETLSESFKTKAETIFGAVIAEREAEIKEYYEKVLAETVSTNEQELAEKVDEYLSYVVEEWYKENKIALERSLRAEIAENFIEGLKNLFTDNFISIPDEKVDVLEAANAKIEELTAQVNEEIKNGLERTKTINELQTKIAFSESVEGLTLSEIEKLKKLSESIEFDSVDEYKNKLNVLKETYFKNPVKGNRETLVEDVNAAKEATMSSSMAAYTRTLSKFRN